MKTVFTTGEAAKICKVSQQTIIRCFDSGQLKGFRVPGSRFRRIGKTHVANENFAILEPLVNLAMRKAPPLLGLGTRGPDKIRLAGEHLESQPGQPLG